MSKYCGHCVNWGDGMDSALSVLTSGLNLFDSIFLEGKNRIGAMDERLCKTIVKKRKKNTSAAFCKYYQSKDENETEEVIRELRIGEGDYRDQTIDIEITLQNLNELIDNEEVDLNYQKKIVKILHKFASKSCDIKLSLALCYKRGYMVPDNFSKYVDLLKENCIKQHVKSMSLFFQGFFTSISEGKTDVNNEFIDVVFNCGLAAADKGDVDAQYLVGKIFAEGIYMKKNLKNAEHYLTLAVEQGCEDADYFLVENFPADKR